MSAAPKIELTGPRASSAVICKRKAVLEGRGEPAAPFGEQTLRYFRRGHAIANYIRGEIFAEYRAAGRRPRAEEVITWPAANPIGEGHADIYVPHEKGIVEIVTCKDATPGPHKFLQAALYALNHPNAEQASVLAIDPHTFDEQVYTSEDHEYPVDLAGLEPKVREIEEAVVEGLNGGELPPRPFKHPGTFWCQTCPFRGTCWEGWERPERDVMLSDPALELTAEALADAQQTKAEYAAGEKRMAPEVKRLRELILQDIEVGQEVEVGQVLVNSWHVSGSRTLDFATLEAAGHTLPAELAPFVKTSAGYDMVTAKRLWKGDAA